MFVKDAAGWTVGGLLGCSLETWLHIEPGFPISLWHRTRRIARLARIFMGSDARNPATDDGTLSVKKNTSPGVPGGSAWTPTESTVSGAGSPAEQKTLVVLGGLLYNVVPTGQPQWKSWCESRFPRIGL